MDLNTSKRRGLVGKMVSVLIRPETWRCAVYFVRLVWLVGRIYDQWRH
ncbi:hypothetical protein PBR20603_03446 [Pandoraea bronchicola]|uniref:Uncharacterized protein n=1 Tax=Pandoraea bronchicola TaxID=2508287 RepID=A0A5E5BV53_9BURK|nr:hypothetical protein PBR20603_03446 [Pandoraea bronchicola]